MEIKNENCIYLASKVENAQWKKDHTLVCPICGKTFIGYGNNPYPVAKDGLCCDDCNMWVIVMRCWLDSNHDWLKGLVDGLLRNRMTTSHSYINGKSIAYTFYKDELTKKLDVVVVCDDECIEKVVEGALRNWITDNCSDVNLEDVRELSKVGVRAVTNDMKIEFELEVKGGKTDCYEESVVATKANEISERLEKVFENTDFQVDFINDRSIEVSTITISSNSNESIMIDIDDSFINITGYDNDECCREEGVRCCPESDDVDVLYEKIKDAVITVYAGINEYRMNEMFNN